MLPLLTPACRSPQAGEHIHSQSTPSPLPVVEIRMLEAGGYRIEDEHCSAARLGAAYSARVTQVDGSEDRYRGETRVIANEPALANWAELMPVMEAYVARATGPLYVEGELVPFSICASCEADARGTGFAPILLENVNDQADLLLRMRPASGGSSLVSVRPDCSVQDFARLLAALNESAITVNFERTAPPKDALCSIEEYDWEDPPADELEE